MTRAQASSNVLCGLRSLRLAWAWLRQVSGDAAYENYLRYARRASSPASEDSLSPIPSRAEFYVDCLRRRYSTVSRCC